MTYISTNSKQIHFLLRHYLQIPECLITKPLVDIVLDRGDGELDRLVGGFQDLVSTGQTGQNVTIGLSDGTIKADLENDFKIQNY